MTNLYVCPHCRINAIGQHEWNCPNTSQFQYGYSDASQSMSMTETEHTLSALVELTKDPDRMRMFMEKMKELNRLIREVLELMP